MVVILKYHYSKPEKKRDEARELLKQDIDPQVHKAAIEERRQEEINSTFEKVATDWFKVKSGKGLAESTIKRTWESLVLHLFPYIGKKSIFTLDVQRILSPQWSL